MNIIGRFLLALCPIGLLGLVAKWVGPAVQRRARIKGEALLAEREALTGTAASPRLWPTEEMATLLRSWGIPYMKVAGGSIPESDLEAIHDVIAATCTAPVVGIHVGNFVGISLAYMATRLNAMDERNVILSVDPNLPHRGITETERIVTRLLRALNVQESVVRIQGYSLSKSLSNDGLTIDGYNPVQHYIEEDSPEWQLRNLTKVIAGRVDFIMLDGNHDALYLREEVQVCGRLLRPGGHLFLDDISEAWMELKEEFESLKHLEGFAADFIGTRTGVLRKDEKEPNLRGPTKEGPELPAIGSHP